MNAQLLAQLAEKKNLAPCMSHSQLARNLSNHFRRAAVAAAAQAVAPVPVVDEEAKSSLTTAQFPKKGRQDHRERAPQLRGKLTKSEQRIRLSMCVQQPRGTYIPQTGPGYGSQ
jgi:hypothetical protein